MIYLRYLRVKRRRLLSVLIIYIGLLSLLVNLFAYDTEAQAQEIGGERSRWQITPSLSLYQQYTDNVDLMPEDPVSAFITEFSPGLMFQLPSARRQIRINTNLRLDYRQRDDGYTETLYWYNLWGYLGHQYSPRTSYELNMGYDIYYTEKELGAPFVDVFGALTRSDVFHIQPSLSYDVTKTTTAKLAFRYGFSTYADPRGVDGTDIESSLFVTQQIGSRINLGTGATYRIISYDNETGYTEMEIPINLYLDLTYMQLKLNTAYVTRTYETGASIGAKSFDDETFFLYGIGFELGGQLLRLRSTTMELNYGTNYYDDLYGSPYENQELRLSLYHAFKKFDFFTDLKYGINTYTQLDNKIGYWGGGAGLKWYITNKAQMNFNADYTSYEYEFEESNTYDLITANIDYSYNVYDWLFVGLGLGHQQSTSDVEAGNYSENRGSVFARATW